MLGAAIGYFIPSIFINFANQGDNSYMRNQIFLMMIWTAVVATLICVSVIIFFGDKPKVPPSLSNICEIQQNLWQNIKALV